MKKVSFIFVLLICIVTLLVSCATTDSSATQETTQSEEWWLNDPIDTADYHFAVGMAKGSTDQTSREWAKANANTALASYINTTVKAITTTYMNDAGEVGETVNTQAIQAFEQLSIQKATAVLRGVTYKYHKENDGTWYALASLPLGQLAEELKSTVQEAFVKNEASAAANKMMNDAIYKYFVTSGI